MARHTDRNVEGEISKQSCRLFSSVLGATKMPRMIVRVTMAGLLPLSLSSCAVTNMADSNPSIQREASSQKQERDRLEACAVVPIASLLDGSEPGEVTHVPASGDDLEHVVWGDGENHVAQFAGTAAIAIAGGHDIEFDAEHFPDDQIVRTASGVHIVVPVSEWGVGNVQIRFSQDDCHYVNILPPGVSQEDALEFARRD